MDEREQNLQISSAKFSKNILVNYRIKQKNDILQNFK
jgi:hypothetical protein